MAKVFNYDEVPAVSTKAGKVKGYEFDGVHIFKGIPYAQAGRFQMPREVEAVMRRVPPLNRRPMTVLIWQYREMSLLCL